MKLNALGVIAGLDFQARANWRSLVSLPSGKSESSFNVVSLVVLSCVIFNTRKVSAYRKPMSRIISLEIGVVTVKLTILQSGRRCKIVDRIVSCNGSFFANTQN